MSDQVFRDIVVERVSSPDRLDQAVRIIGVREWLSLLALVLVVAVAVVWGFEGRVATRTEGQGVLIPAGADEAGGLELQIFLPVLKAQELRPGMPVEVVPGSVRVEEYGFIKGKVGTVDEMAAADAYLAATLRDNPLGQTIAAERPVAEVHVELLRDPATPSGYRWSTKSGAPLKLSHSIRCLARIIVREDAPVTLAIPALKRWIESL